MCMEDVRLGRATHGSIRTVLVGNTVTPIVETGETRRSLFIGSNASNDIFISRDNTVGVGTGFRIPANTIGLQLTLEEHGDLVRSELWGIAAVASNIGIIESFLDAQ